ncbi:MAG TPA: Asp-tRNA(Asn)/Glu-tRNA(Gln) amidotransferase subunit GatC [Candidatus Paceibacterota bacterium]|nr:Asp-tRNA(Asn)/Glu-tRNA(Gln) amidotransferase subunit GatC [Candidatus Paceibacterota bacterium]
MASEIDKKTIEYLAELARIKLDPEEEQKFIKDLKKILAHFEELESLDTSGVETMNGGTEIKNSFREDVERINTNQGSGADVFPESKDGFLKVPPVFE